MKQLKLEQACLLDVSGELSHEASGILREHAETYPSAMLAYDQALTEFKRLESLPHLESQVDHITLERMKQRVKDSLHDAIKNRRKDTRRLTMRRYFYRSMSIASGMAAAFVILAGVYIVRQNLQTRQQRIMDAENTFQEMAESDLPYSSDNSIQKIQTRINHFGAGNMFDAQTGNSNTGIMNLFNALDKISLPDADDDVSQPGNIQ